jgi:hypothetical protein
MLSAQPQLGGRTMADDTLILKALETIAFHDSESLRLRAWVNDADKMMGNEPRFGDIAAGSPFVSAAPGSRTPKRWQPGALLGKQFATAVRMVLLARFEAANEPSPASVDDIHEALSQGTYDFGTSGADAQKQSIRISLGKNTAAFVRLPNTDLFGLVEWYPGLKKAGKARRNGEKDHGTSTAADESGGDEGVEEAAGSAVGAASKMPWTDQK